MAINITKLVQDAASASGITGKGTNTAFDLLNPSKLRLDVAGLLPGGLGSVGKVLSQIGFQSSGGNGVASEDDWRLRISLADNSPPIFYKDAENSLMSLLAETNGVIFPYTPTVNVTHQARYSEQRLTHSNYPAQNYQGSEVNEIQVTGTFTAQNVQEGQYMLAAIQFFRSATKMFFGANERNFGLTGNPPPMVYLDGYGSHYLPHVPCVITSFNHVMPDDVDYIEVPVTTSSLVEVPVQQDPNNFGAVNYLNNSGMSNIPAHLNGNPLVQPKTKTAFSSVTTTTRIPTASSMTIQLRPIYSRKSVHEQFGLKDFSQGKLIGKDGGGFL
jgi:hypothetical protein